MLSPSEDEARPISPERALVIACAGVHWALRRMSEDNHELARVGLVRTLKEIGLWADLGGQHD